MDLGIAGKVALVTASSQGLGRKIALGLAAEGVNLVLFSRSGEKLNAVAREIEQQHKVRVVAVPGDMCVAADVDRLVETLKREFGGPDIFVLNTGRPPNQMRALLDETDAERWNDGYQVQLWAAIQVAGKVVPLMLDRGWGRIIAITSASVKQPMHKHGISTIFRAGVTAYMKHLANEIGSTGVTVNCLCPGSINTVHRGSADRTPEENAARLKILPLGRLGSQEELTGVVSFFASVHSGFITGASLQVDGGMVASLY